MTRWTQAEHVGSAGALHQATPDTPWRRTVWVLEPAGPALVLGSTQPEADIDCERAAVAGVEIARRRSGGGAVWLRADDTLWVDIFLPRDDALWDDDVGTSARWLGETWARALTSLGVPDVDVHDGALVCTRDSRRICFAGIGPSEVVVDAGKAVGISQRRSREGARFQCAALLRWQPGEWAPLFAAPILDDLDAAGSAIDRPATALLQAFLEQLRDVGIKP